MNPFLDRPTASVFRRSWGQRLVLLMNVALIAMSLTLAGLLSYAGDRSASVNRVELRRSLTELDDAESGARVINILLVGSDSSESLDPDDPIQVGRDGERFGDVIIVAHIDERSGDVALLSLPRDLWVPIAGTERSSRINRAFLVGGPAMLIDTIEENFDIPIHHYVNVDFAGFQGLVEAVGSVEVAFDSPARDWNVNAEPEPRSQTGFMVETAGCHALGPEQALAYVRSRYYQVQGPDGTWQTDPTSDLGRIARQQDFMRRLVQRAIDRGARNPLVLADLIDTGIENVAIDQELTPALLLDLSATYRSFEPGQIQSFTYPAVDGTVGSNRVLLPQHDEADALRSLFGGDPFTDPSTISVGLHYDSTLDVPDTDTDTDTVPPVVDALLEEFDDVGISPDVTTEDNLDRGLWIQHGPDGSQAAGVVATALAEVGRPDASILEVPHLSGREVVVVVGPGATPSIGRHGADVAAGPERDEVGPAELAGGTLGGSNDLERNVADPTTSSDEVRQGVLSVGPNAQPEIASGEPEQLADQGEQAASAPTRCS